MTRLQRASSRSPESSSSSPESSSSSSSSITPASTTTATVSNESYTYRSVALYKPMGLILQQEDTENEDDGNAVKIAEIKGAAAKASQGGIIDVCIGDVVVKVGTKECTNWTLEQVMDEISEIDDESQPVDLTLQRPADAIPVKFMDTGACIAAKEDMSIGALGFMANSEISYSCRNGNCGTCQHVMVTHDLKGRTRQEYVRPCVAKVPKGMRSVSIIPCDGYEDCLLK